MGAGSAASDQCSLPTNPVESTALRLRKTDIRNGGTHAVLSPTESRGRPHAGVERMAQEAKAWGNAQDMLTWARRIGWESCQ